MLFDGHGGRAADSCGGKGRLSGKYDAIDTLSVVVVGNAASSDAEDVGMGIIYGSRKDIWKGQ